MTWHHVALAALAVGLLAYAVKTGAPEYALHYIAATSIAIIGGLFGHAGRPSAHPQDKPK